MEKIYRNPVDTLAVFTTRNADDVIIISDSSRNYSDDSCDWNSTYILKDVGGFCDTRYASNIYDIIRELKTFDVIHYIHPDHMEILFYFLDDDYIQDDDDAQRLLNELENINRTEGYIK